MFARNNHELTQIEETIREEKTKAEGMDNTLIKYFFSEDVRATMTTINNEEKKITPEKLSKLFNKNIRLRNALKQCYWDRSTTNMQV
jgi:hypothetical protein